MATRWAHVKNTNEGCPFAGNTGDHDPLVELVDRNVTDAMIDAVGWEAAKGRMLIIAHVD